MPIHSDARGSGIRIPLSGSYRYLAVSQDRQEHPRERAAERAAGSLGLAPCEPKSCPSAPAGDLAEAVQHGGLVHAGNGAERCARLFGRHLTLEVGAGITLQWNCRAAALLGAVMPNPSSQIYRNRPPARQCHRLGRPCAMFRWKRSYCANANIF